MDEDPADWDGFTGVIPPCDSCGAPALDEQLRPWTGEYQEGDCPDCGAPETEARS